MMLFWLARSSSFMLPTVFALTSQRRFFARGGMTPDSNVRKRFKDVMSIFVRTFARSAAMINCERLGNWRRPATAAETKSPEPDAIFLMET